MNLKEKVQALLKPINFQFHLIAGSKAALYSECEGHAWLENGYSETLSPPS